MAQPCCNNFSYSHIPYGIRNLSKLSYLDLSFSSFFGQIPSEMLELSQLQYLDLSSNSDARNSLQLRQPSLRNLVEKLNNLKWIDLSNVNISSPMPNSLANLSSLTYLSLHDCQLQGMIPSSIGILTNLVNLHIYANNIVGELPISIGNLASLQVLDLSVNQLLSSQATSSLGNLAQLTDLDFSYNNFSSQALLTSLGNLTQLSYLDFSNNYFSSGNSSSWSWIGKQSQLSYSGLSHVNFAGLQSNNFCGSIPQLFMSGSSLRMVDISRNRLEGKVPGSLTNCTSLEFLNIGYNQITGNFPSWLGILSELKVLILKSNRFYGVIMEPKTNFEFMKLHVIDFSQNMFTGELPSNWNSMKVVDESQLTYMEDSLQASALFYYAYFDFASYAYAFMMNNKGIEIAYGKISNKLISIVLSGNKFTGEIPASIFNLKALKNLNLSNNNLSGCIPSSLSNLTELESLDLSNNKLSGKIPQELVTLTSLEFINVSHNNLKGRIPEGYQFDTFENRSSEGNSGLCGKPLSKSCENSEASQRAEDGGSESEWESTFAFDWEIVTIGVVSGLIVGVILGNEYFTNINEWFARISGRQLIRVKRRRMGH